jgi:hypothetical protein
MSVRKTKTLFPYSAQRRPIGLPDNRPRLSEVASECQRKMPNMLCLLFDPVPYLVLSEHIHSTPHRPNSQLVSRVGRGR